MEHTLNGTIVITNCLRNMALSESNQEVLAVSHLFSTFGTWYAKAVKFAYATNLFLVHPFSFMPHLSGKTTAFYFL